MIIHGLKVLRLLRTMDNLEYELSSFLLKLPVNIKQKGGRKYYVKIACI